MVISVGTSRREQKKSAVRSKIIDTAIDLFSKQGIAGVTVEQIADAADIGKGTIYNYFHTKEAIVMAYMVDMENKVQSDLHRFARLQGDLASILTCAAWAAKSIKSPQMKFWRRTGRFATIEQQRYEDKSVINGDICVDARNRDGNARSHYQCRQYQQQEVQIDPGDRQAMCGIGTHRGPDRRDPPHVHICQ
jgi:AcrR family transcriptional regulator